MRDLALIFVVAAAFSVEAALGFGATVIAVTLGAFLIPIPSLLPALVPVNMVLSAFIVAREPGAVDRAVLGRRVLPFMALGLPVGLWVFQTAPAAALRVGLGLLVVALAGLQLLREARPHARRRPPSRLASAALLGLAGVIHGALGTGGPLAVYVVGRELMDKRRFRATLSALWLLLNTVVLTTYTCTGRLGLGSLRFSARCAVGLAAGLAVGDLVHRRVPHRLFALLVWAVLLTAGLLLLVP